MSTNYLPIRAAAVKIRLRQPTAMSTGYHVYGIEYLPGKSIKTYFDGDGGPVTGRANIITAAIRADPLERGGQQRRRWLSHDWSAKHASTMRVAEVQAYSH